MSSRKRTGSGGSNDQDDDNHPVDVDDTVAEEGTNSSKGSSGEPGESLTAAEPSLRKDASMDDPPSNKKFKRENSSPPLHSDSSTAAADDDLPLVVVPPEGAPTMAGDDDEDGDVDVENDDEDERQDSAELPGGAEDEPVKQPTAAPSPPNSASKANRSPAAPQRVGYPHAPQQHHHPGMMGMYPPFAPPPMGMPNFYNMPPGHMFPGGYFPPPPGSANSQGMPSNAHGNGPNPYYPMYPQGGAVQHQQQQQQQQQLQQQQQEHRQKQQQMQRQQPSSPSAQRKDSDSSGPQTNGTFGAASPKGDGEEDGKPAHQQSSPPPSSSHAPPPHGMGPWGHPMFPYAPSGAHPFSAAPPPYAMFYPPAYTGGVAPAMGMMMVAAMPFGPMPGGGGAGGPMLPMMMAPPSRGVPLALHCDLEHLSEYQILVRQQLELFEATAEDVESNTQGRKKAIVEGQVGLRCKHCAALPLRARSRGAVYYPSKLQGIYQAAQNMASSHLGESCQTMPRAIREEIHRLRARKDNASGGKQYWADGCRAQQVVETEDGLRFERNSNPHVTKESATSI